METWASVEELLGAQSGVHEVEINVYGRPFNVYWAELDNSEFPSIVPPNLDKMTEADKMSYLTKLNEEITFAMIEKGQKMQEAKVGELKFKFSKETFSKLIPRIRSDIVGSIWQIRDTNNRNL